MTHHFTSLEREAVKRLAEKLKHHHQSARSAYALATWEVAHHKLHPSTIRRLAAEYMRERREWVRRMEGHHRR